MNLVTFGYVYTSMYEVYILVMFFNWVMALRADAAERGNLFFFSPSLKGEKKL